MGFRIGLTRGEKQSELLKPEELSATAFKSRILGDQSGLKPCKTPSFSHANGSKGVRTGQATKWHEWSHFGGL